MNGHGNIVALRQPGAIDDPQTGRLRNGARQWPAQAVEMQAQAFPAGMKGMKLTDWRDRLVRRGHGPGRNILTGIGPVAVSSRTS